VKNATIVLLPISDPILVWPIDKSE